jgi:hypothetical protein
MACLRRLMARAQGPSTESMQRPAEAELNGRATSKARQVTGNVTKRGGAFCIDHPLDPLNKYLQHSFVEPRHDEYLQRQCGHRRQRIRNGHAARMVQPLIDATSSP